MTGLPERALPRGALRPHFPSREETCLQPQEVSEMTTQTNAQNQTLPLFAGLGARLKSVLAAIAGASQLAKCAREAEVLARLSDAELARRGLTRDRIIEHAFRHYFGH
jgi:hypothetical protein